MIMTRLRCMGCTSISFRWVQLDGTGALCLTQGGSLDVVTISQVACKWAITCYNLLELECSGKCGNDIPQS